MTAQPLNQHDAIGAPRCPQCARALHDPDPGTLNTGYYEVLCPCGAWVELHRLVDVIVIVQRADTTVPPRVFLGEG